MLTGVQTAYLTGYHYRWWLAVIVVAGLGAWTISPRDDQLDDAICEPDGILAKASARLHGPSFWRAQLPTLEKSITEAKSWDQRSAEMQAMLDKAEAHIRTIYEKHPEMDRSSAPVTRAGRLRATADVIDRAEADQAMSDFMQNRAERLQGCRQKILDMRP